MTIDVDVNCSAVISFNHALHTQRQIRDSTKFSRHLPIMIPSDEAQVTSPSKLGRTHIVVLFVVDDLVVVLFGPEFERSKAAVVFETKPSFGNNTSRLCCCTTEIHVCMLCGRFH